MIIDEQRTATPVVFNPRTNKNTLNLELGVEMLRECT